MSITITITIIIVIIIIIIIMITIHETQERHRAVRRGARGAAAELEDRRQPTLLIAYWHRFSAESI